MRREWMMGRCDMESSNRPRLLEYIAAIWLLLGMALAAQLETWVFFAIWDTQSVTSIADVTSWSQVTPALLLGTPLVALVNFALYPFVRKLGRPLLSKLWLYSVVSALVIYVGGIATNLFHPTEMWIFYLTPLLPVAVMIWFARDVSHISFRHALVFVGLVAIMQFPASILPIFLDAPDRVPDMYTTVSAVVAGSRLILGAVGAWLLVNPVSLLSSSRRLGAAVLLAIGLPALAGGVLTSWAASVGDVGGGPVFLNIPVIFALMTGIYAVVILATYMLRIRNAQGPGGVEPDATVGL